MAIEIVKVNDSIYRFEQQGVRSTLVIGSHLAVLVDTGFGTHGSLKEAVSSVTDKPVMLVISHADPDHIGGNAEFDTAYLHPSEFPHYRSHIADGKILPLLDGEIIDLGDRKLKVILIPGHTPGSIALLDAENRFLISGDSVSKTPVFMFGEWRSAEAYLYSMERLSAIKDEFDEIYTSHGPFGLPAEQIDKHLAAAKKYLAGELTGVEGFIEGRKIYTHDGAGFIA